MEGSAGPPSLPLPAPPPLLATSLPSSPDLITKKMPNTTRPKKARPRKMNRPVLLLRSGCA